VPGAALRAATRCPSWRRNRTWSRGRSATATGCPLQQAWATLPVPVRLTLHNREVDRKCQNSGCATMTVVIFPTWWTIAAK